MIKNKYPYFHFINQHDHKWDDSSTAAIPTKIRLIKFAPSSTFGQFVSLKKLISAMVGMVQGLYNLSESAVACVRELSSQSQLLFLLRIQDT